MAGTIAERIRAELKARRLSREDTLEPKGAVAPQGSTDSDSQSILSSFTRGVAPLLGQTVASEMDAVLERVRGALVGSLERALASLVGRASLAKKPAGEPDSDPGGRSRAPADEEMEESDTDLDLPAAAVAAELDPAFDVTPETAEAAPGTTAGSSRASLRLTPTPAPAKPPATATAGRPLEHGVGFLLDPRSRSASRSDEELEESDTDLDLSVAKVARQLDLDAEVDLETAREPAAQEGTSRRAVGPLSPALGTAAGSSRASPRLTPTPTPAKPPATAAAGRPLEHGEGFLLELRDALVSGIAEGIAGCVDQLERGQKRIADALESLTEKLAALESTTSMEPAFRGEGEKAAGEADFQDAVIRVLKEMESRILGYVASLAPLGGAGRP